MSRLCCSFCGSQAGDFEGHRASICRACVQRMAAVMGWNPSASGPLTMRAREEAARLLAGLPGARLAGMRLVYCARLLLERPVDPEDLQEAVQSLADLMADQEPGLVEVTALPSAPGGLGWLDTPAGPMLVPVPGEGEVDLAASLPALEAWWSHLPDRPHRALGQATAALARGDLAACSLALAEVEPVHACWPEAELLRALLRVVRGARGDWAAASEQLARLARAGSALAAHDRGRLDLALGRPGDAERALATTEVGHARELRREIGAGLLALGDCRRSLHRLGAALEEHRQRAGALPRRLEDLRPEFLVAVPRCGGKAYRYRRSGRGFVLECAAGHPGLPRGYPRWHPRLGPLVRPEEEPPGVPDDVRPASGPLEAMAPHGPLVGFWVAACRESAGDLPGACLALETLSGVEARLHRALLEMRRGLLTQAVESLRGCLGPDLPAHRYPDLLETRLRAAVEFLDHRTPEESFVPRAGLFLALVRAGREDLCARVRPDEAWGNRSQRLAYLCDAVAAGWPEGDPPWRGPDPLVRGLELAWDHVTPAAAVCLEMATFTIPADREWVGLLLARLYRQAGRLAAARSALDSAHDEGASAQKVQLEEALQALEGASGAEELLTVARQHPESTDVVLETVARLMDAGKAPEPEVLRRLADPRAGLLRTLATAREGAVEEALEQFAYWRAEYPEWGSAWLLEARVLEQAGRPEEAVARALEGLARRPRHALLLALLARLLPSEEAAPHQARLRALRPDVEGPLLEGLDVIDWPGPFWGLPLHALQRLGLRAGPAGTVLPETEA